MNKLAVAGLTVALLVVGVLGLGIVGFADTTYWWPVSTSASEGQRDWSLRAQGALIIGGYGDNFNYDGDTVRPLVGTAVLDVDSVTDTGSVIAVIQTTAETGPIQISKDEAIEGEIKLVMRTFIEEAPFMEGGIAEYVWVHGDTQQGPPVMPRQFSYLAGWGLLDIYVNGQLLYRGLDGHFMYTDRARHGPEEGYKVMRDDGTIYSPMLADKTRFTDSSRTELHIVGHSLIEDQGNFPPHSQWIHLNFSDVFVQEAPAGASLILSLAQQTAPQADQPPMAGPQEVRSLLAGGASLGGTPVPR